MTEAIRQDIWDQKVAEVPMGRVGEPEEVANRVLFQANDTALD
jgi:3-oxoacyl-[acyl-carrier protein] reductase